MYIKKNNYNNNYYTNNYQLNILNNVIIIIIILQVIKTKNILTKCKRFRIGTCTCTILLKKYGNKILKSLQSLLKSVHSREIHPWTLSNSRRSPRHSAFFSLYSALTFHHASVTKPSIIIIIIIL